MPTIRANIRPELLRWAREQCHLTVEAAARKIGVSAEALAAWESETDELLPTIRQLREAARVYRFSLAVFYLPQPPTESFQPIRDFRHLPGLGRGDIGPELQMAIREARDKRESALELYAMLEERPSAFTFRTRADVPPDRSAARLREYLNVTEEEQRRWREPGKALAVVRERLESSGVMTLQVTRVDLEQFRGFAIQADVLPVVVVNRADAAAGRLFSLIHETTHLALGMSGVCSASDRGGDGEDVEVYCNAVAGRFLVPTESLLRHPVVSAHQGPWSLPDLDRVASWFAVSRFVIVRRLLDQQRIDQRQFTLLTQALEEDFARTPRKPGRVNPARDVISLSGTILPSLVLQAFSAERISASSVASYLNVRLKHLAGIQVALDRSV